ncbi:hypothetical protein SAMN05421820_116126 [Pedobacter steynii]|uniref:Uncharacterized protein n=1 Tax=Pedobacter steynii TaxID=430522 RepID=A0A1H0KQS2_9SPHI|nr:hypothetical protein [Pedobacter steynii]NQX43356.1 hypothetical protein [Pedobacter steynii]SDO58324.1 hypothetical protein SAMN05421820_116126 [Pedobacter steynii]
MGSKRFFLLMLTCNLFAFGAKAQMDTSHVEIWGVPNGYSEFGYMRFLNEKKVTACMQDLKVSGYKEASVIGLEGLRLVLLRAIPVYSFSPPAKKRKLYPPKKVIDLLYFGIDNDEVNFVKQGYFDFLNKDSAAVDKTIAIYQQLGLQIKKEKVYEKFDLIRSLDSTDKDSCLYFLKWSAEARMKSAALLGYVAQARSKADMLALFPFLLDFTVGDEATTYLTRYLSRVELNALDWQKHHTMFVSTLNCPDPFRATTLMELYQEEKHCKRYARQILADGNVTIVEILKGRRRELDELKTKTVKFLTYLTDQKFGKDYNAWLNYIGKTNL